MSEQKWGYGNPEDKEPWGTAIMGNAQNGRPLELLWGEHPHSRSDNNLYARDKHGTIHEFDGHRILIDVTLKSNNYLKESHYSGDEIRRGGDGLIFADGVQVYEFFFRDVQWALLKAHHLIGQLSEHSSNWLVKREREKLVGRHIYYDRTPAIITSLVEAQGCIIIKPDGVDEFPPPVYARGGEDDPEDRKSIVDTVLTDKIWWFREIAK